jgi:pSer/pThr/pTyr-binding forkhead associated (FHA) protein
VTASEVGEAWLEPKSGGNHILHGSCSLGRSAGNTIVLDSPKVSRRHALIHLQNIGELWLIDFGSSNGTFLNKRRIHHPVRLDEYKTIVTQRTLRQIENIACWLRVADIRNFTPLTQSMRTEGLETLLGNWLSARKNMIEKHGGEINKYLGRAFWPLGGRLRPLSKTSPPSSPS